MEEWQREQIRKKLPGLISNTNVTAMLLSHFESSGKLSASDIEEIESERGNIAKSRKLYNILQTRGGAYTVLRQALDQNCQNGALALLAAHDEREAAATREKKSVPHNLVIGKDIQLKKVEDALKSCSTVSVLYDNLLPFARRLELPHPGIMKAKADMRAGDYGNALYDVLEGWAVTKGHEATLEALVEALVAENWNALADKLREEFTERIFNFLDCFPEREKVEKEQS